jgi:hypothetical protein
LPRGSLMKSLSIVLCLLAACDLALAKEVPLPRAKPLAAADPPSLAPIPEVLPLHDAEAWPSDCALRLGEIARFEHQPVLFKRPHLQCQCLAVDVRLTASGVRLSVECFRRTDASAPPAESLPALKFFQKRLSRTKATPFYVQNHFWAGFWERGREQNRKMESPLPGG